MYRVNDILTPEERLGAIRHGMITKLASMGIGPAKFMRMVKGAQASSGGGASNPDSWISALFKLSLGLGIPIGTLHYALSSSIKPNRNRNRKQKAVLDQYNDIVAKYKQQAKEQEKDDEAELGYGDFSKAAGVRAWAESHPVLTLGAGGLMVGGSLAALSGMISDHIEAKRQRKLKQERESDEISPDTVVLRIRKKAEDSTVSEEQQPAGGKIPQTTPVPKVEPTVEGRDVKYMGAQQPREPNGRYSTLGKTAFDRMVNNGFGLAAFIASMPLGYKLVDSLHTRLEEKRIKSQIAAAQQEYIDLLDGKPAEKDAEAFLDFIGLEHPEFEKTAQANPAPAKPTMLGNVAGWLGGIADKAKNQNTTLGKYWKGVEDLGSAGIAMLLLGTGASAYITNKLLHKNFDKPEEEEEEPQKVTRILFKNGSSEQEITPEQFIATIDVLRDCILDSTPIEKFAAEFAKDDKGWQAYNSFADASKNFGFKNPWEMAEFMRSDDTSLRTPNAQWYPSVGMMREAQKLRGQWTPQQLKNYVVSKYGQEAFDKASPANIRAAYYAGQNTQFNDPTEAVKSMDPGAMQHLLNAYGAEKYGLKSSDTYENFIEKYPELAGKFAGVAGSLDPSKVRGVVHQYMQSRPGEWMSLLGNEQNAAFRQAAVGNYLKELAGKNNFFGKLLRTPYIGNFLQTLMRGFMGTGWGQKMLAGKAYENVTGRQAGNFLDQFRFNGGNGGWYSMQPAQPVQAQTAAQPATAAPQVNNVVKS